MLRKEVNFNLAFISTLVVSYMMRDSFFARGQVLSYSIFLLEYMLVENFAERPTFFKSLALFALSVIMANCHSTAWIMMLILLLPVIGEQIFYAYSLDGVNKRLLKRFKKKYKDAKNSGASGEELEKIESKIKEQEEFEKHYAQTETKREHKIIVKSKPNIKYIWVAAVVLILGALVTPLKLTPFLYVLKTSLGNSMGYINEHLPIVPANSVEFFAYTIIIVAILGFTNSKLKLYDAFLILGLYIMTLTGRRSQYLLYGLTAPIIVKAIDDFIKYNIKEVKTNISNKLFIFTCIISVGVSVYMFIDKINDDHVSEKLYPVKAAQFVKENLDYRNIRIYNGYDYGSYLLMQGIPVFIDSRCDLYTPEFNKGVVVFDDFMETRSGEITISDLLDKYDLEYAIVKSDGFENSYMSEDDRYTKLYSDENFVVFKYK